MSVFTKAYWDAENEEIVLFRVDETGAEIGSGSGDYRGAVKIRLADTTPDSGATYYEIKLREWDVCVDDGEGHTVTKKALFLSSPAY
jgi:hypothetical protein